MLCFPPGSFVTSMFPHEVLIGVDDIHRMLARRRWGNVCRRWLAFTDMAPAQERWIGAGGMLLATSDGATHRSLHLMPYRAGASVSGEIWAPAHASVASLRGASR